MKLKEPTKEFIDEILAYYDKEEGNEFNDNLLKLFKTFDNDTNKYDVLIKVSSLNKLYSTAIININPVVEKILQVTKENNKPQKTEDFISLVDKISKVEWINKKGKLFKRNNLSFASKYVHFLSGYETPIYDSYIWIIIKGYLGQNNLNEQISFTNPKNFNDFYITFQKFKKEFNLEEYSNYSIDKYLWQYGKTLITDIELELNTSLEKSKSELQKRIKSYKVVH